MSAPLAMFRERLDDTWLRGRRTIALTLPASEQHAFAVLIEAVELERFWPTADALAQLSGLRPIAAPAWFGGGDWSEAVREANFFNRFEYEQESDGGDTSPAAILRAADGVEPAAFLLQLDIQRRHEEEELEALARKPGNARHWQTAVDAAIEGCRVEYGDAPTAEAVLAAIGSEHASDRHAIEHFLLRWEQARGHRRDPQLAVQPWFDPTGKDHVALIFLPIACSWDALAYLHWFGANCYRRSANVIALGRHWHKRHGAELVAHYGTMLQCLVARPPLDAGAAWTLAIEHDLLSPYTRAAPGIDLRHYAQGLVGSDRWFLHERP